MSPNRRRNTRTSRSTRRPAVRRARRNTNANTASVTLRGGSTAPDRSAWRSVKSLSGANEKYIQTTLAQGVNAVNFTATNPINVCMNAVAQGTSENTRIGRLCKLKWLDLNIETWFTNVTSCQNTLVRIYVIVENTALGSALSPNQFFLDNTTWTPMSQRDRTNRNASRYVVLWDSGPYAMSNLGTATGTAPFSVAGVLPSDKCWSKRIPLNFDTDYSRGNAGTVADIDTNALSLIVVADTNTANELYCNATWTVAFQDDS